MPLPAMHRILLSEHLNSWAMEAYKRESEQTNVFLGYSHLSRQQPILMVDGLPISLGL